ncbi:MAG: DinB family protein [Blastocatellia bacterium]
MNLNDIRQLLDYTEYANHLVLDAAEQLTEEQLRQDVKISHGSIFGTLVHMAAGEWIWLERWLGNSPAGLWKEDAFADLKTLRAEWQKLESNRKAFLDSLSEETLQADLNYKNVKGEPHSLPLVALMQHVVNHATLHRGQVVGMIRQLGITPPAVDLLFYLLAQKKSGKV